MEKDKALKIFKLVKDGLNVYGDPWMTHPEAVEFQKQLEQHRGEAGCLWQLQCLVAAFLPYVAKQRFLALQALDPVLLQQERVKVFAVRSAVSLKDSIASSRTGPLFPGVAPCL